METAFSYDQTKSRLGKTMVIMNMACLDPPTPQIYSPLPPSTGYDHVSLHEDNAIPWTLPDKRCSVFTPTFM